MAEQLRAVGYVRVSTVEQAREGWSLAAQRKRIKAYCEQQGWKLVRTYADEGISGKARTRRPAYDKMLREALMDGIDRIVAVKLDRLGRSAGQLLTMCERVERKGIGVVTIHEQIDTSTAAGRMFRGMLAVFAEFERDLISDRTKAGLIEARAAGKHVGRVPFGKRVRDGQLVDDPEARATIERVRSMRQEGASLRKIAAELSTEGKRWYPNHVAQILEREQVGS